MGSGIKRKPNDQTIVRRPFKIGLSGMEAPGNNGSIAADICIPSFDQRVSKTSLTKTGVSVRLQKEGANYTIYIGENWIGALSTKNAAMVAKCATLAVKYVGKIVTKKSNPYARFIRVSG